MFNKICVLGCGLIGSSLLRAIEKKKLSREISAFDKSKDVSTYLDKNFSFNIAKSLKIIDEFFLILLKFINKKLVKLLLVAIFNFLNSL